MRLYVVMAIALLSLSAVAQGRKPQDRCTFVTDTVMVHDPVMAVEDGLCHLFSTGNGLQHATSADRRTWTVHGEPVLADIPAWTRDSVPGFNRHVWDKALFKEMTGFAGWSMFGNLSAVLFGQGLNMLLNVFFGPVVNAARAVAVQVQGAMQQFVGNFQMALNPQITKTYAKGDMEGMHKLMFRSARFSFYLLFLLSLPVLFEADFILAVWLKTVPDNTVVFLRIMVCTSLIYSLANPLIVANQATGKVRRYQMVCGTILLMILPVSYVCLRLGFPAYSVFIVHFCMEAVVQAARMLMLRPLIGVRLRDYFVNVYSRVFVVVALSVLAPLFVYESMDGTVVRFFAVGAACVLSVGVVAYTVGLTGGERVFVRSKAVGLCKKIFQR